VSSRAIELIRKDSGATVGATLHTGLSPSDVLVVERAWADSRARVIAELSQTGVPRLQWPQSLHWNWEAKAAQLRLLEASCAGIFCEERWQGLMMIRTAVQSAVLPPDSGRPLVYVDFLEAAPWNWRIKPLGQEPQFKGVGSLLFREAVEQSFKEDFHGRVGLHALPQAEAFYEGVCGMTRVRPDARKQNLVYFEFTRQQAQRFLSGGKP
jgi:hypothetical protein